jgi:hypothetical protein
MKLTNLLAVLLAFSSPAFAETINTDTNSSGKLLATTPVTAATPECPDGDDNADGCLEGAAKDANGSGNSIVEVQASNANDQGAINANIYKDGKLLATAPVTAAASK